MKLNLGLLIWKPLFWLLLVWWALMRLLGLKVMVLERLRYDSNYERWILYSNEWLIMDDLLIYTRNWIAAMVGLPMLHQNKFVSSPYFGRPLALCYRCIFGYFKEKIYFTTCINVSWKLSGSPDKVLDIYELFPMCCCFGTAFGKGVFCLRFLRLYYAKYIYKT
jgi:hypothetical protein